MCAAPCQPRAFPYQIDPRQKETLRQILKKPFEEIAAEFDSLPQDHSPPPRTHTTIPFCSEHSLIITNAPKYDLDIFLNLIYKECDMVLVLLDASEEHSYFGSQFFIVAKENLKIYSDSIDESTLKISPTYTDLPAKQILHYHCKKPIDPQALAQLSRLAMRAEKPLIHCSLGIGRSGVLAAALIAYKMILSGSHSLDVIKKSVEQLRLLRPACIQNGMEYFTIYRTVTTLLEEDGLLQKDCADSPGDNKIDRHR